MLGYVIAKPRRKDGPTDDDLRMPGDLRQRLRPWIDVDEVGADGFWLWLRAVVPILPVPTRAGSPRPVAGLPTVEELRELRSRLVVYAREHARLRVISDQRSRDNRVLARRLKALEAALRTLEIAGHRVEIPEDEEAANAAIRQLPPERSRGWFARESSKR